MRKCSYSIAVQSNGDLLYDGINSLRRISVALQVGFSRHDTYNNVSDSDSVQPYLSHKNKYHFLVNRPMVSVADIAVYNIYQGSALAVASSAMFSSTSPPAVM